MHGLNFKDIIGGALLTLLGAFVFYTAFGFGIGTATRMEAGYFPMLLGIALMALGAGIILSGARLPEPPPTLAARPFVAVIGGMLGFFLTVDRLGLVPAIWVLVGLSALGDRDMTLRSCLALMAGVSAAAWLLFTVVLGLPLDAFVRPL